MLLKFQLFLSICQLPSLNINLNSLVIINYFRIILGLCLLSYIVTFFFVHCIVSEARSTFMNIHIRIKCILYRIITEKECFNVLMFNVFFKHWFMTLCIKSCNSLPSENSSIWTEIFGIFILYLNLSYIKF